MNKKEAPAITNVHEKLEAARRAAMEAENAATNHGDKTMSDQQTKRDEQARNCEIGSGSSYNELLSGMREACEIMNRQLHNGDRFCTDCIEWLTRRGKVSVVRVRESWSVTGIGFASADESLTAALCGAVHSAASIDEMEAWDAASDERRMLNDGKQSTNTTATA